MRIRARVPRIVSLFALLLFGGLPAVAQDAVPIEILKRTMLIKWGDEAGTAFKTESHLQIYLITARHIVQGIPKSNATLKVWNLNKWEDLHITDVIYPKSEQVDIAILKTEEKISAPYEITASGETTFGQVVWFLGYPFYLRTRGSNFEIPFIKRGTMSAIDATNSDAVILYIDGFNNPGFSGGPIVFWSFSDHAYRILGVVQGYRNDTAKTLINGRAADTPILVNSGILLGYSIAHATEAIQRFEKDSDK